MKGKSNKSKIVKTIVVIAFLLSVIIVCNLVYHKVASKYPSVWANFCLILSVSICYFVFKKDQYDEREAQVVALEEGNIFFGKREDESENVPTEKVKKLKWSSLMKDITWDRAQEIIQKKGKGWRFPTKEEFYDEMYHFPYEYRYWLDDRRVYSKSYHHEVVAVRNVKAHLLLVREV